MLIQLTMSLCLRLCLSSLHLNNYFPAIFVSNLSEFDMYRFFARTLALILKRDINSNDLLF